MTVQPLLALLELPPARLVLQGTLPALLVALAALGLSWRVWSGARRGLDAGTAWGAPLALGVGFFASYVGIHGWPPASFYPDMKARLAWMALAVTLFGLVQSGTQRAHRVPFALLLAACSAWLVAHWRIQGQWTWSLTLEWGAGALAAGFVGWEALETLARRRPGPLLPLAWALAVAISAQAFYLARSESHARLASGLAVALGVAFLVGLRQRGLALARGGVAVLVPVFFGLALANHLTAYLPDRALALVLAAPLAPWLAELPLVAERSPRVRAVVTLVLAVAPALAAAWLAHDANASAGPADYLRSLGR